MTAHPSFPIPNRLLSSCQRSRNVSALFSLLAPACLAAAPLKTYAFASWSGWWFALLLTSVFAGAAYFHQAERRITRLGGSAAAIVFCGASILDDLANPARGLVLLIGLISLINYVWPDERLRVFQLMRFKQRPQRRVFATALVATLFGLDMWLKVDQRPQPLQLAAISITFLFPIIIAANQGGKRNPHLRFLLPPAAVAALMPALAFANPLLWKNLTAIGCAGPLVLCLIKTPYMLKSRMRPDVRRKEPSALDAILEQPSRVMVLSFVAICLVGSLMLALPLAAAEKLPVSWLDAAFTAVSATCVTGLVVLDTPTAYSGFGIVVILLLIQIGGLGIMVFSAAAIVLLGKRLSLSHERAAVDLVGAGGRADLKRSIQAIFAVTVLTEGLATLLLALCFYLDGDAFGTALWRGLFTAISAFCNAGFALQSDSLVPYADNPVVLLILSATIIIGGLGPAVITALLSGRRGGRLPLHARLVLWTSFIITILPALFITLVEWNNTLAGLHPVHKIVNGFFQSVTLRTAGFNSIDLGAVHPATWTLMVMVMFVGGSPASTAGGVKTTTIAVIFLAVTAVSSGRSKVEIFGRRITDGTVLRATAVATLAVLGSGLALAAVQLTQTLPLDVAVFEVVSALATVGLSIGGSSQLDEVGKIIIMVCMFAGRVGPLTLFVFLSSNQRKNDLKQYPPETIPIG